MCEIVNTMKLPCTQGYSSVVLIATPIYYAHFLVSGLSYIIGVVYQFVGESFLDRLK